MIRKERKQLYLKDELLELRQRLDELAKSEAERELAEKRLLESEEISQSCLLYQSRIFPNMLKSSRLSSGEKFQNPSRLNGFIKTDQSDGVKLMFL